MSDSDEVVAGQTLAIEEARKLDAVRPDHPLLRYLREMANNATWEEFIATFGKPGLSRKAQGAYLAQAYIWAKYWVALREANQDPNKKIVVNHDPPVICHTVVGTAHVRASVIDLDDDIPF